MGNTSDPQDFEGGLARQRRLLAESTDVHERDRELLEQWLRRKDGQVATSSLKTYLRRVRAGSERAGVPLVAMSEQDWHDFVFDLRHDHGLADSTVQSYEAAILMYLDDMTDLEWPADVERTSVDRDGPNEDELLEPADIQALTETARHQRDVAFIEFLADTGARLSLALSLRVQDVDLEGATATYTPNPNAEGLKGADVTAYPLIDSAASLRAYLETSHPRPDTPAAALFHKLLPASRAGDDQRWPDDDDGGLVANAARQQLHRIADRAGVDKPTNPHAFRHAAITRMAREGYSRSQIEHRVQWTVDSSMWQTYEHITSTEHNQDIFQQAGIVEADDGPDQTRRRCGTCNELVAVYRDTCPNCGDAVDHEFRELVDELSTVVDDRMVDADDPDDRRDLVKLRRTLTDRPGVLDKDRLHELLASSSSESD